MGCLKCGRETRQSQVFCPTCQEAMQDYPVKPGTVIHLPHREAPGAERPFSDTQWESSSSDQLIRLRKLIRWLTATIALLSVLLCLAAGMLVYTLKSDTPTPNIGRNYTTTQENANP